jgi:hypothetical protein
MTDESTGTWWKPLILASIILAVLAMIYYLYESYTSGEHSIQNTFSTKSMYDGENYRVHTAKDAQEAADMLAKLNNMAVELMGHLRRKYIRNGAQAFVTPEVYKYRREAVEKLLTRYNPDNLVENSFKDPGGDTAYSLDKGAIMAICLRDKRPGPTYGKIHDIGILTFVTIHEMAHIALDIMDHPPEFWSMFQFLLKEAEEAGIYKSPDFAHNPVNYCGMTVNYSPRWDTSLVPV